MEVVNKQSALLSNFEVLSLLRELEGDHLARTRTALRIKKEEEAAGLASSKSHAPPEEVLENLRTVEVEAIQYLSADFQPTSSQTESGIAQLAKNLSSYDLTKAEKLQIVNLAPTEPVELYVIVEELEDRLGTRMDDILSTVRSSLNEPSTQPLVQEPQAVGVEEDIVPEPEFDTEDAEGWEYDANEVLFDDTGEGAGVEGDLDVDDD
ncbi:hypothetical protein NLI96_g7479 [Meripilus lineatus]|uniref:DNA-directed RNA polymerase III subunit RPC9 n=1 Tax=Meripilus lineatus TaxID=2056292 RepID=A0AAD5UZ50_9APHY|nr:hypothetical protein NLI96_g7479 [Physisporinus lineatus]